MEDGRPAILPDGGPPDEELVRLALEDPAAFALLYRRHIGRVHRFAWRATGSREAAEDICAAAFERVLVDLPRFRWRDGGFRAWLDRIVAARIAEHHRERSRHRTPRARRAHLRAVPTGGADPADMAVADEEADRVRAAIGRLRRRYATALWLRYYAGLTPAEAAETMGVRPGTFNVLCHRALRALERELAGDPSGPRRTGSHDDG